MPMALFGVRSVPEAIQAIEGAVGITFAARDSAYLGPYDLAELERPGDRSKIVFQLRENVDPMWSRGDPAEEQLAEPRFPEWRHLLYLSDADDTLVELLTRCGLVLLDREV
jgi:hypothetical protein